MKRARLLSSVALALLLGVGVAAAQAPSAPELKKEVSPSPAPAAIQNAPPDKIAPNMKAGKVDAETHKTPEKSSAADPRTGMKNSYETGGTTGQGAGGPSGKMSSEQRSKIGTLLRARKVEPAHLTVSVNVGTRIPESVHSYPLPSEVVEIYPEWRGYDYIMIGDQVLVVDPQTHEIVAIIEA
jgi:hypothetical protein